MSIITCYYRMCHCRSIVAAGFVHCVHNYVNASLMRVSQCRSIVANTHTHTEKKTAKLHAMDEKRQTITKEKTRTKHVDMKWTTKQIFIFLLFFSSSASRLCIRSSLSFALDTIASVTHTKTKNVLQVITLFMCIVPVMLVIYSNGKKDTEKKNTTKLLL